MLLLRTFVTISAVCTDEAADQILIGTDPQTRYDSTSNWNQQMPISIMHIIYQLHTKKEKQP